MAKQDLYHKLNIEDVLASLISIKDERKITETIKLRKKATDNVIDRFEKQFDLSFPEDYKRFLRLSNGVKIDDIDLDGLTNNLYNFIYVADDEREREFPIIRLSLGNTGDYVVMNLKKPTGAKNPDRRDILDIPNGTEEGVVIAKTFTEFLYRMLEGLKKPHPEDSTANMLHYWLMQDFKGYREYLGTQFDEYKPVKK
ncbi:MAG TPA: SMI1/KNR4 family protein [Candidatus Nanoarchaeia archaeon]|nr:SMI1/KNR4 family protein [Candidatus Nanoarchaeia archaeon]